MNLIPKLEEDIPKLQKTLLEEERILDEIKENSKGKMAFFQISGFIFSAMLFFSI